MKKSAVLCAALVVASCQDVGDVTAPDGAQFARSGGQTVDVIVALDPGFGPGGHAANKARAAEIAQGLGLSPRFTYGTALFGFAASVPSGRLAALERDPRVRYVEADGVASIPMPRAAAPPWCPDNPTHPACSGEEEPDVPTDQITPWGITRVGGAGDGTGKTVWVIDTGVDLDHADLIVDGSRSVNFSGQGKDSPDDGHGHGTHVAGTIAAVDNNLDVVGVAAGATVVSVRVLGPSGSGSYSAVIAGVDYVAANAGPGDVANMSLGGPGSTSLDAAVTAAAGAGVKFALAAGNEGDDVGGYSPARVEHPNVFTTSAIGQSDCLASWSNYGSEVDYAAPGVGVLSTKKGGGTTTFSGTSMAAPHVAGVLLLGPSDKDGTACGDPDGDPDPIVHR